MHIESIIFDLDGTLFNSIEDIADANNAMLRNHGFPEHDLQKYIGWIGNGASKLVYASLPKEVYESSKNLEQYLHEYSKRYAEGVAIKSDLYPGIEALLNFVSDKNISMSINTNKPQFLTNLVYQQYLINWHFKFVFGQSKEFPMKPNPAAALFISQNLRIAPENILFIGDSEVDVKTAEAAGMIPMAVPWGYGSIDLIGTTEKGIVVNTPGEIIDFLKQNS